VRSPIKNQTQTFFPLLREYHASFSFVAPAQALFTHPILRLMHQLQKLCRIVKRHGIRFF
jgi:hypothetical protein